MQSGFSTDISHTKEERQRSNVSQEVHTDLRCSRCSRWLNVWCHQIENLEGFSWLRKEYHERFEQTWVGRTEGGDEHLVVNEIGHVVRARTARRCVDVPMLSSSLLQPVRISNLSVNMKRSPLESQDDRVKQRRVLQHPEEDEVMIGEVQVNEEAEHIRSEVSTTEFDDWQQKEYEGILGELRRQNDFMSFHGVPSSEVANKEVIKTCWVLKPHGERSLTQAEQDRQFFGNGPRKLHSVRACGRRTSLRDMVRKLKQKFLVKKVDYLAKVEDS